MFLTGDITIPAYNKVPELAEINHIIKDDVLFANLEGNIINEISVSKFQNKPIVFNSDKAIKRIKNSVNLRYLNITNNHIFDTDENLDSLYEFSEENNLGLIGDKNEYLKIKDSYNNFLINSFGWDLINCRPGNNNKKLNIINLKKIKQGIEKARNSNPDYKILIYFHWGIELESIPSPYMRRVAHECINAGADLIIGSHSHCIQSCEIYKSKPIIYGMGNFMFTEKYYWNGKLKYNESSKYSLMVEVKDKIIIHVLKNSNNIVSLIESVEVNSLKSKFFKNITNFSANNYKQFYEQNKRKSLLLPTINYYDNKPTVFLKTKWVLLRHKLILFFKYILKTIN